MRGELMERIAITHRRLAEEMASVWQILRCVARFLALSCSVT